MLTSTVARHLVGSAAAKASKQTSSSSHQVFTPDLEKHGLAYRELAENNPYANVEYRQSWLQKVLSNLGFRTNYDSYLEGMKLQAQEYDNALIQKEYDEKYNSPTAQAQRERAAGINPDLSGDVSSGEASPLADDGNPPVPPESDDLSVISNFAGSVIQGVELAFGVFGNIQNFRSNWLSNQGKQIQNSKDFMSFTTDAINHILPAVYSDKSGPDWSIADNYYETYKKAFGKHLSKRQFRKFISQARVFEDGLATSSAEWSLREGRSRSRKNAFGIFSGDSSYSEVDETMRVISQELSNLATEVSKTAMEKDVASNLNELDRQNLVVPAQNAADSAFQRGRDGSLEARVHNSGISTDLDIKKEELKGLRYKRKLRNSYDRILSHLDSLASQGNTFAQIAQMIISSIILKTIGE